MIKLIGKSLHTGKDSSVTIKPSEQKGIIFIKNGVEIEASIKNVISTARGVTLGSNGETIMTVEHLLSTLYALNISSAKIEVEGDELPVLDGSALEYARVAKKLFNTTAPSNDLLQLGKSVSLMKDNKFIIYMPCSEYRITFILNYPHPRLKNQSLTFNVDSDNYIKEIAPARTYGFYSEIQELIRRGLGIGGSLKTCVIITDTGYKNKRLRFKDECVRHKILDTIGDLSLTGKRIKGHIIAFASGHTLNIEFAEMLLNSR